MKETVIIFMIAMVLSGCVYNRCPKLNDEIAKNINKFRTIDSLKSEEGVSLLYETNGMVKASLIFDCKCED